MDSSKKVVLVTGASMGIGESVAGYLCRRGYRVYGTSRRVKKGKLHETPGQPVMLNMDVTGDASVGEAIEQIFAKEGRLDVVINNAGYGLAGPVEETAVEEAAAQFETNFFGTLRVCRAVLPLMRGAAGGCIINISSLAGLIAIPFQAFYSASKYAVEGFTEALRMEVRPFGIKVVLIEPGDTKSGFTANRLVAGEAGSESSPYHENFRRSLGVMERDEQNGPSPDSLARLVERVIRARNPRLRYAVAPFSQKSALVLKKVLPSRLFESSLMSYYRVK